MKNLSFMLFIFFCSFSIVRAQSNSIPSETEIKRAIVDEVQNKVRVCFSANGIFVSISEIGKFNEKGKFWPVKVDTLACYMEGPPSTYLGLSLDGLDYFKLYKNNKGDLKADAIGKWGWIVSPNEKENNYGENIINEDDLDKSVEWISTSWQTLSDDRVELVKLGKDSTNSKWILLVINTTLKLQKNKYGEYIVPTTMDKYERAINLIKIISQQPESIVIYKNFDKEFNDWQKQEITSLLKSVGLEYSF